MSQEPNYPKETETQATVDPVPEEFDSAIAPQGYEPELVEEIADMETPAQKRRKAIRYLIWTTLLIVGTIYICAPDQSELPPDVPIPYGIEDRPLPRADLFLRQIAPQTVGPFNLVHQSVERSFAEPFVGADVATATYTNDQGQAVTVSIINAGSYINANRYLTGVKKSIQEEGADPTTIIDRIWLTHSFVEWDSPNLGNRAHGFAWSNENYYYSATSANAENRDYFAENFPF